MIHSVAYGSRSVIDPAEFDAELEALLRHARAHNAAAGITGGLMVAGDRFVQVLEGDRGVVDPLLRRIERDRRHTDFVVVIREWRADRRFGGWSMARIDGTAEALAALPFNQPEAIPEWIGLLAERARRQAGQDARERAA